MKGLGIVVLLLGTIGIGGSAGLVVVGKMTIAGPPSAESEKGWTPELQDKQEALLRGYVTVARRLWFPSLLVLVVGFILLALS